MDAIAHHLRAVARDLGLPGSGIARSRVAALLADYAARGAFPRNRVAPEGRPRPVAVPGGFAVRPTAAPVFVDPHGAACAVGHLLRVTGASALAERVARRGNLRWVAEIDEPEVAGWAAGHGLTAADLARIQPSYPYVPPVERVFEARIDVAQSAMSGERAGASLRIAQYAVRWCLDHHPPAEPGPIRIVRECVPSSCAFELYGGPDELLRCVGEGLALTRGDAESRVDLVFVPAPGRGDAAPSDSELAAMARGRPAPLALPRFYEPSLELWVDPHSLRSGGVPVDASPLLLEIGVMERCVRVEGSAPAEGTARIRRGPYGAAVRLEAGPALESRLDCLDNIQGLWRTLPTVLDLEATVRIVLPGQGPPGWVHPADAL